jgi:hypothetical protein
MNLPSTVYCLTADCLPLTAYRSLVCPTSSYHPRWKRPRDNRRQTLRFPGGLWQPPATLCVPKAARGGVSTPIFRLRFDQRPGLLAAGLSSVSETFRNRGGRDISGGRSGRDPHARFLRRIRSGESASVAICPAPSSSLKASTPGVGVLLESDYSSGPRNSRKSRLIQAPFSKRGAARVPNDGAGQRATVPAGQPQMERPRAGSERRGHSISALFPSYR